MLLECLAGGVSSQKHPHRLPCHELSGHPRRTLMVEETTSPICTAWRGAVPGVIQVGRHSGGPLLRGSKVVLLHAHPCSS